MAGPTHGDEFRFSVHPRGAFLLVYQSGQASDEDVIRSMQLKVDGMLEPGVCEAVIFDNRATATPDEWVRAMMWSWLSKHRLLQKVALVQETERSRARSTRRALRSLGKVLRQGGAGPEIVAFTSLRQAEHWVSSLSPAPAGEC